MVGRSPIICYCWLLVVGRSPIFVVGRSPVSGHQWLLVAAIPLPPAPVDATEDARELTTGIPVVTSGGGS